MAIKHLRDGESFFGPQHAEMHQAFGFHGSVEAPPRAQRRHGGEAKREGGEAREHRAHGGEATHHMHPHGHRVVDVEHMEDGSVVHHHAHGGHTVHHADGYISHHDARGGEVHGAPMAGIEHMHDASEYVHRARGGAVDSDLAQDKRMITRAVHEHEAHDHRGEPETDLKLARGGQAMMPPHARMPHPRHRAVMHGAAPLHEMPVNRPPRNPNTDASPPDAMPGGEMAYGVQPTDEPPVAGSDQGISQLRHGGRARRHHRG